MKKPAGPSQCAGTWAGSERESNALKLFFSGDMPGAGSDGLLGRLMGTGCYQEGQLTPVTKKRRVSSYSGLVPWQTWG